MKIHIKEEFCPKNHSCPAVKRCPTNALVQIKSEAPVIYEDKCLECGKCTKICPTGAIYAKNE